MANCPMRLHEIEVISSVSVRDLSEQENIDLVTGSTNIKDDYFLKIEEPFHIYSIIHDGNVQSYMMIYRVPEFRNYWVGKQGWTSKSQRRTGLFTRLLQYVVSILDTPLILDQQMSVNAIQHLEKNMDKFEVKVLDRKENKIIPKDISLPMYDEKVEGTKYNIIANKDEVFRYAWVLEGYEYRKYKFNSPKSNLIEDRIKENFIDNLKR